jgi:hypothetical protein
MRGACLYRTTRGGAKMTNNISSEKTLSTRKFDNSGMPNLFKFLCNCLAGNYAEKMRPCKVKLFSYIKATDPIDQRATVGEFN